MHPYTILTDPLTILTDPANIALCTDDFDDGICCEQGKGSYNVSVDGWLIGSGGEFESSETVFLGGGSCADTAIDGWAGKRWWQPTPFPTDPR